MIELSLLFIALFISSILGFIYWFYFLKSIVYLTKKLVKRMSHNELILFYFEKYVKKKYIRL